MLDRERQELEDELMATGDGRRCPRHPNQVTSSPDGQFDAPCGVCEAAMEEEAAREAAEAALRGTRNCRWCDGTLAKHEEGCRDSDAPRCSRCRQCRADVAQRYSYGVYAGRYCVPCAKASFRDQCGLGAHGQGDPRELDEPYWEED